MISIWEEIVHSHNSGHDAILITVIDKKGKGPAAVGGKMLISDTGAMLGTLGGGELESLAVSKAQEFMLKHECGMQSYNLSGEHPGGTYTNLDMICGGSVTLFFDYLPAPPTVYIMGMGHVGSSLAGIMEKLNWRVVPVVYRTTQQSKTISGAVELLDFNDIIKQVIPAGLFIVIAGFSHNDDYQMLKAIYQAGWQPIYIGLLASVHKSQVLVNRLKEEIGDDINLTILHSPVGLDIGGNTPQEIALAIAAELQAVYYKKSSNSHLGRNWGLK